MKIPPITIERIDARYEASMTVGDHTLKSRRATPTEAETALLELLENELVGRERAEYTRACRRRGLVHDTTIEAIETHDKETTRC